MYTAYRIYYATPGTNDWKLAEVTLPLTQEQIWHRLRITSRSNPSLEWKSEPTGR